MAQEKIGQNFICPYCKELYDPNEDPEILEILATYHGELEPQEFTCGSCGKDFFVKEYVERTFEAKKALKEFDL